MNILIKDIPKPEPQYITGYAQGYANATKDLQVELSHQRRHRKWALTQASYNLTGTRIWRETSDQWENRAEIFEAEVERLKKDQYLEATTAWQLRAEEAEAKIKELEGWNKKRINHIERLEEEGINLMIEVKELKQTKEKQDGV